MACDLSTTPHFRVQTRQTVTMFSMCSGTDVKVTNSQLPNSPVKRRDLFRNLLVSNIRIQSGKKIWINIPRRWLSNESKSRLCKHEEICESLNFEFRLQNLNAQQIKVSFRKYDPRMLTTYWIWKSPTNRVELPVASLGCREIQDRLMHEWMDNGSLLSNHGSWFRGLTSWTVIGAVSTQFLAAWDTADWLWVVSHTQSDHLQIHRSSF